MSQRAAAQNLHELFGFDISKGSVNQIKAHAAEYYGTAYQSILSKITRGQLVHADETMINIGGVRRVCVGIYEFRRSGLCIQRNSRGNHCS